MSEPVCIAVLSSGAIAALVSGIFSIAVMRMQHKMQKEAAAANKNTAIAEGVKLLLYDRIKHLGNSYIQHGYVTSEQLEDLMMMHKVYHDKDKLNGNGFLNSLMSQVKSLSIRN